MGIPHVSGECRTIEEPLQFHLPCALCDSLFEKKLEAMTGLLLHQGRLFSNTLMINDTPTKSYLYGSEHVAKKDDEKGAGDDFAHPHMTFLLLMSTCFPPVPLFSCVSKPCTPVCQNPRVCQNIVLVCVRTLYLCVSKHQLCFHLIPASLETASVIMVLLLRTICRQAPVIEQICYDMTRTEFLHILN